jgi:hypothetical protein
MSAPSGARDRRARGRTGVVAGLAVVFAVVTIRSCG